MQHPRTTFGPRRRSALLAVIMAVALVLSACASDETSNGGGEDGTATTSAELPGPSDERLDPDLFAAAIAKAQSIAGGEQIGGSIEMIGVNGGGEGAILEGVYDAFEIGTGVTVNYTGTQDMNAILETRVQAGNPPDVVDTSLGSLVDYQATNDLLNLSEVIGDDVLLDNYDEALLSNVTIDGSVYGIYQGFNNFMFWYNPQDFTGPVDAGSWSEIVDWSEQQAASGTAPWCMAQEAGAASGFPGAQFLEILFAKKYGPELLRQWGLGELAWTSPEVRDAFEMFGELATVDDMVDGGVTGALATPIAEAGNGMVTDPPTCHALVWGVWSEGLIRASFPNLLSGEEIDFFQVPGSTPEYANTEIFQATASFAFTDNEQTRAFMTYMASAEAQALLASADQWTVTNINVPVDTYESESLRKAAGLFFSDQASLASGPNVLLGPDVQSAFFSAVVEYMADPSSLDSILENMDAVVAASQ